MLIVTVLEKGGSPKRLEFAKSEVVIGRTPDNDLRSEDGIHWKTLYSGTREWLVGIVGDGRGGVYISGEEGLLLHGPEI